MNTNEPAATALNGMRCEMIFTDAINYAHDLVIECGELDLPHKIEAHNAIDMIEAENAKMKKERDELFRENVRLRSMANGTPDDAFGRLLTFADWWDANHPFSPDEGKLLRKSWAKIVQLQMANAKMREALLIIAGGKEARGNYEEVAWHMAQLAAEAIAVEGGGK